MVDELKGQASPEQIAEWKEKHGEVNMLTLEGHVAYLKNPDRKTLSYAMASMIRNPMQAQEHMLNGCWLGGSEEIKKDDSLFVSFAAKAMDLFDIKEVELKKL